MSFRISGQVRDKESHRGIPNLIVSAFDKDLVFDDLLGEAATDSEGNFQLLYEGRAFNRLFDSRPDIYLRVKTPQGVLLHTTEENVRCEAGAEEHFLVEIARAVLSRAGVPVGESPTTPVSDKFKLLACLAGREDDPLVSSISRDLDANGSILELMHCYLQELEGETDNNAPPFSKLAKLFDLGSTPAHVEGHHYGITLGLRTGDKTGIWAEYANLLGFLWSTSLGKAPPWVGKSFRPMGQDQLDDLAEAPHDDAPAYLGTNHFNEVDQSLLSLTSLLVLTFWMRLNKAPKEETVSYGYEKVGGPFIASRAGSVYHGTPREVLKLNYRWRRLDNLPPLSYLIDEIVEIAEGLYLGQLLFATRQLVGSYDPQVPASEYGYQHFGYFLLMDESWRAEAARVFPHIGIPRAERPSPGGIPRKFTTFTFADPPDGNCNDQLCAQIHEDMAGRETILDLLKSYSDELRENRRAEAPQFAKLRELFNRGISPGQLRGFLRGALVAFKSEGLLAVFNVNLLNVAWGLARMFTPWTGKTFEGIHPNRLRELTDGHETGETPTLWGSNTYSLRTTRKRIVGQAMKVAGIWTEDPSPEERRAWGIDLKSFFFISREGVSISAENQGKRVVQFNYRWPRLTTFPPDNYCLDEVVQIADGLYLGELVYATELLKAYEPTRNPSEYRYRNFGYFLLMDEEWHRHRLTIGFDLDNT